MYFSLYVGMACFVSFVLPIISIILSSYLVYLNKLTVGSIMAIYSLTKMLDEPIRSISIQIGERQIALKTQERLKDIYTIENREYDNKLSDFENLELNINKFSYDNEKTILSDINFKIEKNDIYLIKGQSGCGKTTLANLICNIVNTKYLDGDVKWNKNSILNISNNNYFKKVLKVNQNPFIFEGTIKENILLDDENLEGNLSDILKICNLQEMINEKGLDFKLEENGKNISGGQKQRISLARILIRKPQLLILDEITSSLDKENSNKIAENIIHYIKQNNITTIIISHKNEFDKYCNKSIYL